MGEMMHEWRASSDGCVEWVQCVNSLIVLARLELYAAMLRRITLASIRRYTRLSSHSSQL
jgi:hypothetical protein